MLVSCSEYLTVEIYHINFLPTKKFIQKSALIFLHYFSHTIFGPVLNSCDKVALKKLAGQNSVKYYLLFHSDQKILIIHFHPITQPPPTAEAAETAAAAAAAAATC